MKTSGKFLLAAVLALALTGCGSSGSGKKDSMADVEITGAETLFDGRRYGGVAEGEIGDALENTFFSFCVDSAVLAGEYEGTNARADRVFIVADITVANVYGSELLMWSDDFRLQYGEGEEEYCLPVLKFADAQMEDTYVLETGEAITAQCVYEVPAALDPWEYCIKYTEVYVDEVEGNSFFVYFKL